MRKIETTTAFKRDFKREGKGPHRAVLDTDLKQVITALAGDAPLSAKHRDHALAGDWKDYRDCHVKPDLVLIYRLMDGDGTEDNPDRLILARFGSHSALDL
jgi:mRNA interferase YafQ